MSVTLRDGVRIEAEGVGTVVADAAAPDGNVNVTTHAHGDHLFDADAAPERVVCSATTADLARVRRPEAAFSVADHPRVELLNAGHVAGSRAVRVEGDERTYLYTGDCSPRDRCYLDGLDPVPADVLVIEATYGTPAYVFPEQDELERRIIEWLNDTLDRPVLLFGYALGRAQKLQRLVARSDRPRLFVSEAIADLNAAIETHLDVDFGATEYDSLAPEPGDAVVLPIGSARLDFVDRLVEERDAVTAGFSGWAVEDSFRYRGGYDEAFVLSDHADFEELRAVVDAVDPDQVYTQHGFADEFARELTTRGYDARALKEDQTSLGQF